MTMKSSRGMETDTSHPGVEFHEEDGMLSDGVRARCCVLGSVGRMRRRPIRVTTLVRRCKYFCLVAAFLTALSIQAVPICFELSGTVTEFRTTGLGDMGIGVGSSFSAFFTYDPELGVDMMPDNPVGGFFYAMPVPFSSLTVNIHGHTFTSPADQRLDVNVVNAVDGDSFRAQFSVGRGVISSPWELERAMTYSNFGISLSDPSGLALNSDSLPADMNLSDWRDRLFDIQGNDVDRSYRLSGDITSITRVPESVHSGAMLAFALTSLLFCKRGLRRRRGRKQAEINTTIRKSTN